MQPTSEDEEMSFVSDEDYRRDKNAFHLTKLALEAEQTRKKEKSPIDYWNLNAPTSNKGSPFSKEMKLLDSSSRKVYLL